MSMCEPCEDQPLAVEAVFEVETDEGDAIRGYCACAAHLAPLVTSLFDRGLTVDAVYDIRGIT